ncbi:hypothetical protein M8818_004080 [Zalaria obscura]|uniref:Uncharacterized protein n=1 Tax=Zalaria obscura TaxID=2024903 RepID=A0ACC3SCW6_9PEZI
MAAHGFLYHLHPVRVDDAAVPRRAGAYLHPAVRVRVGHAGLAAGRQRQFRLHARSARASGGLGSGELAFRTGLFISAAPLASSFASSLAYAIVRLGGHTGISSWRLLFLVEGFPSVLVAAAAWGWRWVPDSPETASWLRPRERKIAVLRLRREKPGLGMGEKGSTGSRTEQGRRRGRLDWKEIGKTLADPKSYLTAAMFFSCNVAFSSMPVFAPVIIKDMGYSALAAQGLSAPPYIYSFAVVLLTAWLSDRYSTRSIPIAIHALLAMLGYVGLALTPALHLPNAVRYLCIYPITAGFFSAVTLTIVWTINNQKSDEGKGTGVAVLNVIGQLGPLLGTRLYPDTDEPFFVKGHAVCAFFMLLVAILAGTLRVVLRRANRKGEDVVSGDRDADVPLVREEGRVGRTTTFVYML